QKGVAAPLLSAAYAFQEKCIVAARDFQKRRDRCLQVRGNFARDRNQVVTLAAEVLEFALGRIQHRGSSQFQKVCRPPFQRSVRLLHGRGWKEELFFRPVIMCLSYSALSLQ